MTSLAAEIAYERRDYSRLDLTLMAPRTCCECGRALLTRCPEVMTPDSPCLLRAVVPASVGDCETFCLGNTTWCWACATDPVQARARVLRRRLLKRKKIAALMADPHVARLLAVARGEDGVREMVA